MTVSGYAGDILNCIGETGVATGAAVIWVNCALTWMNTRLNTTHSITGGIMPTGMVAAESGILFDKVICDRYRNLSYQALSNATCDVYFVDLEEQGTLRKVRKTEVAKEARLTWSACCDKLESLINWYQQEGVEACQTLYNYRKSTPEPVSPNDCLAPCPHYAYNWFNPYFYIVT